MKQYALSAVQTLSSLSTCQFSVTLNSHENCNLLDWNLLWPAPSINLQVWVGVFHMLGGSLLVNSFGLGLRKLSIQASLLHGFTICNLCQSTFIHLMSFWWIHIGVADFVNVDFMGSWVLQDTITTVLISMRRIADLQVNLKVLNVCRSQVIMWRFWSSTIWKQRNNGGWQCSHYSQASIDMLASLKFVYEDG